MIAEKDDLNDVAIHWPDEPRRISAVARSGRCPSSSVPRKLRVPGGLVALVAGNGEVLLLFRISHIERVVPVTAPNGKYYKSGNVLVARKKSVRRPRSQDPKVLNVNRNAMGAFAYFDSASYQRVIYEVDRGHRKGGALPVPKPFPAKRYALFSNNIGKTLSRPELELIRDYTSWVGNVDMFAHHQLKETGLYTDLFIPRCWTLIEAKSSTARWVLREAIGQLFDYQRHYDRRPRLAVLLPERPTLSVMELFEKKRIVVVWRSRGSSFRDSVEGALTSDLRAEGRLAK